MFKREFWNKYNFVEASFDSISEAKIWLQELERAIEKVEKWEWYIFIIPWWAESEDSEIHKWFKGLFHRMVKELAPETPLLASKIWYPKNISYPNIYKRAFLWNQSELTATIQSKLINTWEFKWDDWGDMRETYESLFGDKK